MTAEASGVLHITVKEGETVAVGAVVATIDTDAKAPAGAAPQKETANTAGTANTANTASDTRSH